MKRKRLLAFALVLCIAVPAFAVFNEKNIDQTISVLRQELKAEFDKMSRSSANLKMRNDAQHLRMINMMKTCNELSLMLYSQKQDFTFDMTYALKSVTREYEEFNRQKMPFDDIVARLDLEIDRYSRLAEALRRLPPQLSDISNVPDSLKYHNDSVNFDLRLRPSDRLAEGDHRPHRGDSVSMERRRHFRDSLAALSGGGHHSKHGDRDEILTDAMGEAALPSSEEFVDPSTFILDGQGRTDRDSCLFYATEMLNMYSLAKTRIVEDSLHYAESSKRLQESYEYAQARYKVLQKRIFIDGQDNYWKVLKRFRTYWNTAVQDASGKYGSKLIVNDDGTFVKSQWKGPIVLGFIIIIISSIILAALLGFVIVKIVKRYVKRMRDDGFKARERCLIYLCSSFIFAVATMLALPFVPVHNFFVVASTLVLVLAWLLVAILLSLFIRLKDNQTEAGMHLYAPIVLAGLIVIIFRIIFIPNSLVNVILPPMMLLFTIWQLCVCLKYQGNVESGDVVMGWLTLVVFASTTVVCLIGYVFIGVLVLIWWLFQLACIETITAIGEMMSRYDKGKLAAVLSKRNGGRKVSMARIKSGEFVTDTWIYDMLRMAVLPVLAVFSIPFCLRMSADVFDFTEIYRQFYYSPLIALYNAQANPILHVSFFKVILVVALFFVFRYLNYVIKAMYRAVRLDREKKRSGLSYVHANQINFTLADNLISIVLWGIYIVALILLWKIPVGAISVVFAGLATGIGLAMKDILNNFIYGIQLMSGRLRVGDWVECDGVRGKVSAISYQSTQIETIDGAVMSFLNTALFNKNFKNLTRNNSYEFVKIGVGVCYGTDVEKVRGILMEALENVCGKDNYGREIVDPKRGITVAFDSFGDSSVNLAVKQFVLVPEKAGYLAKAQEAIYNALNSNNIEIPFPQRDIHIIK